MKYWRFLFAALLVLASTHVLQLKGHFKLDTGLADVAPKIANSAQSQNAITALRDNIEQRILLLIGGEDEDAVFDATDELSEGLESIASLRVLPSNADLLDQLIEVLEPYRFQLLSPAQAQRLSSTSAQKLVIEAKRSAYSLSDLRLFPFAKDPFGLSTSSLLDTLQQLQVAERNEQGMVFQTIGLSIQGDALNMREQQELSRQLDAIISQAKQTYSVSVDRSGIFFFANHAAQQSKQDISLISSVSTIGVIVLLLFVFRSFLALTLPLVSVLLGVGFAFVVTHFVYGSVHVLTIVFGASLIGIVIDYSLHFFYHTAEGSLHTSANGAADSPSHDQESKALHQSLLLSLCTSLIGYAALSFSGLEALKKVALFSCCGLVMAWLSVVCLGQLATARGLRTEATVLPKLVAGLLTPFKHFSARVLVVITGVTVAIAVAVWFINKPFRDDPRVFFTAPDHLLQSERRVAEVANDYEPGRYVLLIGDSLPHIQQRFQRLQSAIEETTSLPADAFSSVFELVPSLEQQQRAYTLQDKLYAADGALGLLAAELDMLPATVNQLQSDYANARSLTLEPEQVAQVLSQALPPMWFADENGYVAFVLIKKGINSDELSRALIGIDGVEYVNTLEKTKIALAAQRTSASALVILAYALVAALLVLRFRRLDAAAMVAVPLTSTACLIALSVPFGYELNLFHIMSLFLVLGFGMDYSIFVREMREHRAKTLQAILLSALTSLLSFGLLAASAIPVVASFGTALLIGNGFNLLGAFAYSRALSNKL